MCWYLRMSSGICGLVCMVKNRVLKNRASKNRASKNQVLEIRAASKFLIDVAFITLKNNLVALLETLYTGISFLDSRRSFFSINKYLQKGS